MKKDLNNIDEIFKNSLENFEADVDPSIWTNVSQNIGNAVGTTSTSGAVVGGMSKTILSYTVASIAVISTVIGSVYLYNSSAIKLQEGKKQDPISVLSVQESEDKTVEQENIIEENKSVDAVINEDARVVKNKSSEEKRIAKEVAVEEEVNALVKKNVNVETATHINEEETKTSQHTNIIEENINQSNTKKIEVNKVPEITIKSSVTKGQAPLDVEFSVSGEGVSYLWDFGDNTAVTSEESPYHTFKNSGTYKVTLTAIDKDANTKISYQVIEVEKNVVSKLEEIQNVFSPNGDGINDVIKVEGKNIEKFHAVVMDSKGNLVFEWKSMDGFWDGKDNSNNKLARGVYYLVVKAKGKDGEQHIVKKSIQLY